jgi:hypothetical protein
MKFGKKIAAVKGSSDPEWYPFWRKLIAWFPRRQALIVHRAANYKMLKSKIKEIQVLQCESNLSSSMMYAFIHGFNPSNI